MSDNIHDSGSVRPGTDQTGAKELFCQAIAQGSWTDECDELASDRVIAMLRNGRDRDSVIERVTSVGIRRREARKIVDAAARAGFSVATSASTLEDDPLSFDVITALDACPGQPTLAVEAEGAIGVGHGEACVVLRTRPPVAVRIAFVAIGIGVVAGWMAIVGEHPKSRLLQLLTDLVVLVVGCQLVVGVWWRTRFHFSASHHQLRLFEDRGVVGLQGQDGTWLCLRVAPHEGRDPAQQYLLTRALAERYSTGGELPDRV